MLSIARIGIHCVAVVWSVALLLTPWLARADQREDDSAGAFTKYEYYYATYEVNSDGTHVETHEWALKVLAEQGVEGANRTSVTFSDRLQDAEIRAAYTLKKDGRRIDAPANNYQVEGNTGRGEADPMFSDLKTKTVVFPEVGVGDTVVFSYRPTQREALFPGHFSLAHPLSTDEPPDDVQIRLSAPESLKLRVLARGVEGGQIASREGRRHWLWKFRNQQRSKPEAEAVSSMDDGPIILATTFKDYESIGAAYEARARPKSAVTERVRALAEDLTKDTRSARDQVKVLSEWVGKNIRFAGNCVGAGSVVPHEVDRVLANKLGDCKDHTALLQALLEARGIASTPALVQSGSSYKLPELPVADAFNHVMNYIPSLDLYVDSTAEDMPFGSLPYSVAGKPVVLTRMPAAIRRTPQIDYRSNWVRVKTELRFRPDATAEGQTKVEAGGQFASGIKPWFDYMQPRDEEDIVRRALASNGFTGTGTLIRADTSRAADSYSYGSRYEVNDAINLPGPGAVYVYSPFSGPASIGSFARIVTQPPHTREFVCMGGSSTEEFVYRLPDNAEILAIPRGAQFEGKYGFYKATYVRRDNMVTVVRVMERRVPSGVCAPEVDAEYRTMAGIIRKDMRSQLVYR